MVLKAAYGLDDPMDPAAAVALNGGVAYSGGLCGAITGAALAVGMADVGGLSPGFWGDACLVDVSAMALRRFTHDPIELVMAASPGDVAATWLAGREAWRRA